MHDRAEFILSFFCPKNEEPGLKKFFKFIEKFGQEFFLNFLCQCANFIFVKHEVCSVFKYKHVSKIDFQSPWSWDCKIGCISTMN